MVSFLVFIPGATVAQDDKRTKFLKFQNKVPAVQKIKKMNLNP
jgi:hypothetical protein